MRMVRILRMSRCAESALAHARKAGRGACAQWHTALVRCRLRTCEALYGCALVGTALMAPAALPARTIVGCAAGSARDWYCAPAGALDDRVR